MGLPVHWSIAIIAVLSAIAIVNLNTARNKANNVAIKANLSTLPAAAETYYNDNYNDYSGFCTATSIEGVRASVQGINNYACADDVGNPKACFDCDADKYDWIVFGRLHAGNWFCIDGLGTQSITSTPNSGTCI